MKKTSNQTIARSVHSSQRGLHQGVSSLVTKHLLHPFRKPYAAHNQAAFEAAQQWLAETAGPLILDSFCGVGESTRRLATIYPEHRVIGIDKSAHRLARHQGEEERRNYLLVRADVEDFWRLAAAAGWQPSKHFLLYPNPWPKPGQLKYRVHGSPVFPALLALGGQLELRSNWETYVQEFHQALNVAGQTAVVETFTTTDAMTPFERKYAAAQQRLWRCRCALASR